MGEEIIRPTNYRIAIEQMKKHLKNVYIGYINELYDNEKIDKVRLLNNLEQTVYEAEMGLPSLPAPASVPGPATVQYIPKTKKQYISKIEKIQKFNPKKARDIREKEGLSRLALAKKLKLPPKSTSVRLWHYEAGKNIPSERGRVGPKYIKWLNERGYRFQ